MGSGAAFQDPTGFPMFHDMKAPSGPAITERGAWSEPERLSGQDGGGYRPQIAVSPLDDRLHVLFYERTDHGDLIRHRSKAAGAWSAPSPLGFDDERNWGPDLVARDDGSVVVVFDHAKADMSSRGYLTVLSGSSWSEPQPLTADDPQGEIGSGHVAHDAQGGLAYIWIGKKMSPTARFQAFARWQVDGAWTEQVALSDGSEDAWHTNVERRPDGSMLAGWDIGTGGAETRLHVVEGRDGTWGTIEDISASSRPGERPHFAFGEQDHIAWFHKEHGQPTSVYVRSGKPGAWGELVEPSAGLGGFHFDPDIAIRPDGTLCLVWGWDQGQDAELVYSLNRGQGWETPKKVADIDWGKPGLPSLDVDSQGRFHVVWNQGVRGENHVYHAVLSP
jgi:hypothetical protein